MNKYNKIYQDHLLNSNLSGIGSDKIQLLSKYFILRGNCSLDDDQNLIEDNKFLTYCPATSDYLLCFPQTAINSTIHFPCPYRSYLQLRENIGNLC